MTLTLAVADLFLYDFLRLKALEDWDMIVRTRGELGYRFAHGLSAVVTIGVLLGVGIGSARAAVEIVVSFTYVENELSPHPGVRKLARSVTIFMQDNGQILSKNLVEGERNISLGGNEDKSDLSGNQCKSTIRALNGTLFIVRDCKGLYAVVTKIKTNGKDSCSATRNYRRQSGNKNFENTRLSNHEHMILSDVHAENVTCSIRVP